MSFMDASSVASSTNIIMVPMASLGAGSAYSLTFCERIHPFGLVGVSGVIAVLA